MVSAQVSHPLGSEGRSISGPGRSGWGWWCAHPGPGRRDNHPEEVVGCGVCGSDSWVAGRKGLGSMSARGGGGVVCDRFLWVGSRGAVVYGWCKGGNSRKAKETLESRGSSTQDPSLGGLKERSMNRRWSFDPRF